MLKLMQQRKLVNTCMRVLFNVNQAVYNFITFQKHLTNTKLLNYSDVPSSFNFISICIHLVRMKPSEALYIEQAARPASGDANILLPVKIFYSVFLVLEI